MTNEDRETVIFMPFFQETIRLWNGNYNHESMILSSQAATAELTSPIWECQKYFCSYGAGSYLYNEPSKQHLAMVALLPALLIDSDICTLTGKV